MVQKMFKISRLWSQSRKWTTIDEIWDNKAWSDKRNNREGLFLRHILFFHPWTSCELLKYYCSWMSKNHFSDSDWKINKYLKNKFICHSESEKIYHFEIPRTRSVCSGPLSFSVSGPTLWNSLPFVVKETLERSRGTWKQFCFQNFVFQ